MTADIKTISQLVITPAYPPVDVSVTLINARILSKLGQERINNIILTTSTEDTSLFVNNKMLDIFPESKNIIRIRCFEKGGTFVNTVRKTIKWLFPFLFHLPDPHFIWMVQSIFALFNIKNKYDIDIIQSISSPYAGHIVAFFAKKIFKKPWICHLDDFWVDQTIYAPYFFDIYKFAHVFFEKKCFSKADVILSTSREIIEYAQKRYPSEMHNKFKYIPPGFDPDHYNHTSLPSGNKYIFSYLGKLYPGKRDPLTLLNAILIIKEKHPHIYQQLHFKLIGQNCMDYSSIAQKSFLDVVTFYKQLDYLESIKVMVSSHVLIHFGYMNGVINEDIHVSGKLFEYIGANRLILGITTNKGPVADFIRNSNGVIAEYNSAEEIAQNIIAIVSTYTSKQLCEWQNPTEIMQAYNVNTVVKEYRKLFDFLTNDIAR